MTLNLRDPQSIATWFKVNPQRHAAFLRWALRQEAYAPFHAAIAVSREMVK
jgi:hypothetical protein